MLAFELFIHECEKFRITEMYICRSSVKGEIKYWQLIKEETALNEVPFISNDE
jgi:hypothetical protein